MPLRSEFSQVVPEACEVAPMAGWFKIRAGRENGSGEAGGPVGDLVEVAVVGSEGFAVGTIYPAAAGASFPGIIRIDITKGGE